jgi:hypothetical protein
MRPRVEEVGASREESVAALSIACAEEISSCGLNFSPESIFAEMVAFKAAQKEAGTRFPPPADLRAKQDALKECFRSMKEELNALDILPVENNCVDALQAARKHGKGGKGGRGDKPQLCADSSRPACADGQKPSFNRETMTMVCSDGFSTPLCADGTAPVLPEGFKAGRNGKGGDKRPQFRQQQQRPWSNFGSQFSSRFGGVYMPQQQQGAYMPQQQRFGEVYMPQQQQGAYMPQQQRFRSSRSG